MDDVVAIGVADLEARGVDGLDVGRPVVDDRDVVAGGTGVRATAAGTVGGERAQVGQRRMAGATRKLAAEFFFALGEAIVEAGETITVEEVIEPEAPAPGLNLWLWVGGVLALVAALLWTIG